MISSSATLLSIAISNVVVLFSIRLFGSFRFSLLTSTGLDISSSITSLIFGIGASLIFGAVKTSKDFIAGTSDKEYDSFIAKIELLASLSEILDIDEKDGMIKSLSFLTRFIFPSIKASLLPR